MCFGWIDGLRKKIDDDAYKVRFTPRRPGSKWSAKNLEGVKRLIAEGRMQSPGLREYESRGQEKADYSYERRKDAKLTVGYEKRFKSNRAAWKFFREQAPWYRRTAAFWVLGAKKEETWLRRLGQLIEDSANERTIRSADATEGIGGRMRFIQQTRREFLSATFRGGAATIAVSAVPGWPAWPRGDNDGYGALAQAVASQLGTVPFDVEWSQAFDEPISQGLGGRVIHKLATLTPETLVTANEHFFVRTAKPALLGSTENWHIAVGGLVDEPVGLALDSLVPLAESQGVHVLECSGNPRRRSFGLMSACEWVGIPAVDVLELTRPLSRATRVLIGGFDEHSGRGGGIPGASWIFDPADLEAAGAFFATHMNGERLPDDHGYPVRLFIPGWYGCAAAKWVDRIEWVDDAALATEQMKEYASRTGTDGVPELARDYARGEMDLAAMPVRIEKWTTDGAMFYRVIGIVWGGKATAGNLDIRFGEEAPWNPIEGFEHRDVATWNLWSYTWRPTRPGSYTIRLRVPDSPVPTRRIDRGYYDRTVTIEDV